MEKLCDNDEWASDDEDIVVRLDKNMANREWDQVESNVEKDGYRQGLEANQETVLQEGFNTAFKQAFEMALAAGMVHGEICSRLHRPSLVSSATVTNIPEERTACKESQILEDVNGRVSTLISSIPSQLCPEGEEIEHCCSTSDASQSHACMCRSSTVQLNVKERDSSCSNQLTVKFLDQINSLKSSLTSTGNV